MNRENNDQATHTFRLALVATLAGAPLLLFLFLPLVVYRLNLADVAVSKWVIAVSGLVLTMAVTVALSLLALIPVARRILTRAGEIAFLVILCLIAFPNRTGELTGMMNQTGITGMILPILKILLLATAALLWAKFRPRQLAWINRSLLVGVMAVCAWVLAGPDSVYDQTRKESQQSQEYFTRLGRTRNVIVIVCDGFTGYRMVEVLRERPQLKEQLRGFTLYPRAIAPAVNTSVGIGAILSGSLKWSYSAGDQVQRNSQNIRYSFLREAQQQGFRVSFQSPLQPPRSTVPAASETAFIDRERSPNEAFQEYCDFWADTLPRILPPLAYPSSDLDDTGGRSSVAAMPQNRSERRALVRQAAFRMFTDRLHVGSDPDRIIFFHTWLTHTPYLLSETGEIDRNADSYSTSIYATKELLRLFHRLQTLHSYDSSLIIVAADHGLMNIRDAGMGGVFAPGKTLDRIHNPLLMIKPPAARQPLQTSVMSVWLGDVNATIYDYLGLSGQSPRRYDNRSLLQDEYPERRLNVPIFDHLSGVNYHSSLKLWPRHRISGTFRDYGLLNR